jgi:hypothetical protein
MGDPRIRYHTGRAFEPGSLPSSFLLSPLASTHLHLLLFFAHSTPHLPTLSSATRRNSLAALSLSRHAPPPFRFNSFQLPDFSLPFFASLAQRSSLSSICFCSGGPNAGNVAHRPEGRRTGGGLGDATPLLSRASIGAITRFRRVAVIRRELMRQLLRLVGKTLVEGASERGEIATNFPGAHSYKQRVARLELRRETSQFKSIYYLAIVSARAHI